MKRNENSFGPPVTVGDFADGPDVMLWNPHLSRARRRVEAFRAAFPGRVVLCGLLGAGFMAAGIAWGTGFAAALTAGLGLLAVASAAFTAAANIMGFDTDHCHKDGRRCRLERHRGEFFYRTRDFADFGDVVRDNVSSIIRTTGYLHATPVRGWLDPGLPREAHRIAWATLTWLDHTRTSPVAVGRPATDPGSCEPGTNAAEIDRVVSEVAYHLRACVTLTEAWTAKLHHRHTELCVAQAPDTPHRDQTNRITIAAEGLPQAVFAYLTAARDVTEAGPFPWEQNQPASTPAGRLGSRPARENTTSDGPTP
jgi:hypothetical protein